MLEGVSATALWSDGERCHGVLTDAGAIASAATVLTTGGGAALWARTTNPRGAIGAGSVLAHAAGAELADLELCQFHPTALALPGARQDGALITEAVRGEGATLLDAAGRRFTDELAPRDQVTAAILDRIDADGSAHVLLDLRGIDHRRFPNVFAVCREAGLDPEREPVPVAPAAHYLIGGIAADLDGRTSLPGCSPSASARAAACTAPTGSPRTRSASASSSAAAPRAPRSTTADPGRPAGSARVAIQAADRRDPRGGLAPCGPAPRRGRARATARGPLSARAR